jgi:hypothetical protein
MKNVIKKIGVAAFFAVAAGQSGIASAHVINGSLGTAASATDWSTVTCPAGTAEFYADILDTSAADGVLPTVLISKTGALATTDNPEGGAASASVTLVNSNGLYNIYVTHSGATAAATNYTVNVHCQTAAHAHTATQPNPVVKQNQ